MDASESGMPSLTDPCRGHERWWMRRTFEERLRVAAPSGEQRKFPNGGSEKGPAVRPLATCAVMSADRALVTAGEAKADFKFVQVCEEVLSPVNPKFAPCRIIWIKEDTNFLSG